jgi:hypothetical protein
MFALGIDVAGLNDTEKMIQRLEEERDQVALQRAKRILWIPCACLGALALLMWTQVLVRTGIVL